MQIPRNAPPLFVLQLKKTRRELAQFFFFSGLLGNVLGDPDRSLGAPIRARNLNGSRKMDVVRAVGLSVPQDMLKRLALSDRALDVCTRRLAIFGVDMRPIPLAVPVRLRG